MNASVMRITRVRIKVAKSELMFSIPILAKIAVSAANTADITAQNCQEENAVTARAYAGSLLLALITGLASRLLSSLINSRAAVWFADCADMPAVNITIELISAGSGPTSSAPGTDMILGMTMRPSSTLPSATSSDTISPSVSTAFDLI